MYTWILDYIYVLQICCMVFRGVSVPVKLSILEKLKPWAYILDGVVANATPHVGVPGKSIQRYTWPMTAISATVGEAQRQDAAKERRCALAAIIDDVSLCKAALGRRCPSTRLNRTYPSYNCEASCSAPLQQSKAGPRLRCWMRCLSAPGWGSAWRASAASWQSWSKSKAAHMAQVIPRRNCIAVTVGRQWCLQWRMLAALCEPQDLASQRSGCISSSVKYVCGI